MHSESIFLQTYSHVDMENEEKNSIYPNIKKLLAG